MRLVRQAFPDRPAFDMAVTHALLRRVAGGALPPLVRVFRPGPTVAFGRLDALADGYAAAAAAARAHGAEPVLRLGGGHAAAYGSRAVLVEAVIPQEHAIAEGLEERFRTGAGWIVDALAGLGVRGRVGELPGEYCAGAWSVHAGGVKVAGLAQRSVRGAALLTGFVVAEGGEALLALLTDVYAALGIAWDPATAGAADDVAPSVTVAAMEQALVEATAAGAPLALDEATLALAAELEPEHRVTARAPAAAAPDQCRSPR